MDGLLCDELLQEVFRRLPPPSAAAVCLVCKRWLRLLRSSTTSLSLRIPSHSTPSSAVAAFLSHHPYLSSLNVISGGDFPITDASDYLLFAVSSSNCNRLLNLRLLPGPVSAFSLLPLSLSSPNLTSLSIALCNPITLRWLAAFHSLRHLSLFLSASAGKFDFEGDEVKSDWGIGEHAPGLPIESLKLTGIRADDQALGWVWRNCKSLRRLRLRSCEGIGDGGPYSSFIQCLQNVEQVELMACRTISDGVLLRLAEHCFSLNSLLIYDGGSNDGFLQFINHCRCNNLQRVDLRLPLDLDNEHLLAMGYSFRSLSSLRLQSCCLVTGEGLKNISEAMSSGLKELALINCDVVEMEPGLLAALGQNLGQLRKLDLSHNDFLLDKELISMLVSCNHLRDLNLRGCKLLTSATIVSMLKACRHLESLEIVHCSRIEATALESFVLNSPNLKRLLVEASKLTEVARKEASRRMVEVMYD